MILRGPNGIGKTSLLNVLAGLTQPAHGATHLAQSRAETQFDVSENSLFLGHKLGLKQHQTVHQNLSFFSRFYGRDQEIVDAAMVSLSLLRLQDLPVRLLSAGQKQRTAFARLLIAKRLIWLLDEPTASLDAQTSALIETLCQEHLKQGGVLVAATHLPFLEGSDTARTLNLQDFVPEQRWIAEI